MQIHINTYKQTKKERRRNRDGERKRERETETTAAVSLRYQMKYCSEQFKYLHMNYRGPEGVINGYCTYSIV